MPAFAVFGASRDGVTLEGSWSNSLGGLLGVRAAMTGLVVRQWNSRCEDDHLLAFLPGVDRLGRLALRQIRRRPGRATIVATSCI